MSTSRYAMIAGLVSVVVLVITLVSCNQSAKTEGVASDSDTLRKLSNHSQNLTRQIFPTLVRVVVKKREVIQSRDDLSILFGDNLALPREDLGSGMFIDDQGRVLTNFHVVRDAASIEIIDFDGRRSAADVVGTDALTDLAVIKSNLTDSRPIEWGDAEAISAGALVWAFGSPFGLENSVSLGIVSSNRSAKISDSPFQDFVQTDVATNPGSSGGPLVNFDAKVIGVNTAIAGDKFQGVSFAIPSSLARKVAIELVARGNIDRGWLGVELIAVDADRARRSGLEDIKGVYIQSADSGEQGEQGLMAGDICLEINGKVVNDPIQFSRIIAATPIGSLIKVLVLRRGNRLTVEVRVAARPGQ